MYKKTKVRDVLKLVNDGMSNLYISEVLSISRNSIIKIKESFENSNVTIDEMLDKTDDEIYDLLFPTKFKRVSKFESVDYNYVHNELKKTGVNLNLLWEEYKDRCIKENKKYCSYVTFTINYGKYTNSKNFTSIISHKPGEVIEVDWSGPTMKFTNNDTGEIITVYLFVATLPYSQKTFVYGTTSMDQTSWMECNVKMLEYFGGIPLKIVCDNLKTGVIEHPKIGEIVINEEYLSFGEYYGVAIIPTGVRKPKEKPSVEGNVGKIATSVIAKLRNETFYSLDGLNNAIYKACEEFNNKPFQKREGSRNSSFEIEEKHLLRPLPQIPYEICSWSFSHKVIFNSHISFKNNWYSVPYSYIGKKVDIKYNNKKVYIYYEKNQISEHDIFLSYIKNKYRTNLNHLPANKKWEPVTYDSLILKATIIGEYTLKVCEKLFNEPKVKEQAFNAVLAIVNMSKVYDIKIIDSACKIALDNYSIPHYKEVLYYIKKERNINENEIKDNIKENNTSNVRGADYYKGSIE